MSAVHGVGTLEWGIGRLASQNYDGGYGGTCYECPFASPPLERSGRVARWEDIDNDPTEAWFRCDLPTRKPDAERLAWGEYAKCDADEWVAWLLSAVAMLRDNARREDAAG